MTVQSFEEFLADPDRLRILPARPKRDPMSSAEKLEEAEFLIRGGIAPRVAAGQVGVTFETLLQYARRHGRPDLSRLFQSQDTFNTWNASADGRHDETTPGNRFSRPVRSLTQAGRPTTPPRNTDKPTRAHGEGAS